MFYIMDAYKFSNRISIEITFFILSVLLGAVISSLFFVLSIRTTFRSGLDYYYYHYHIQSTQRYAIN